MPMVSLRTPGTREPMRMGQALPYGRIQPKLTCTIGIARVAPMTSVLSRCCFVRSEVAEGITLYGQMTFGGHALGSIEEGCVLSFCLPAGEARRRPWDGEQPLPADLFRAVEADPKRAVVQTLECVLHFAQPGRSAFKIANCHVAFQGVLDLI